MLGFAQLLELDVRHPLTPAQQPWVVQIQQAGWHLLEMINDVLDLSRIESGNLRLQTETLHLADVLTASISMVVGGLVRSHPVSEPSSTDTAPPLPSATISASVPAPISPSCSGAMRADTRPCSSASPVSHRASDSTCSAGTRIASCIRYSFLITGISDQRQRARAVDATTG